MIANRWAMDAHALCTVTMVGWIDLSRTHGGGCDSGPHRPGTSILDGTVGHQAGWAVSRPFHDAVERDWWCTMVAVGSVRCGRMSHGVGTARPRQPVERASMRPNWHVAQSAGAGTHRQLHGQRRCRHRVRQIASGGIPGGRRPATGGACPRGDTGGEGENRTPDLGIMRPPL
jgi:hypothetical protein